MINFPLANKYSLLFSRDKKNKLATANVQRSMANNFFTPLYNFCFPHQTLLSCPPNVSRVSYTCALSSIYSITSFF